MPKLVRKGSKRRDEPRLSTIREGAYLSNLVAGACNGDEQAEVIAPDLGRMGGPVCRILDTDFGEWYFYVVG